MSNGKDFQFKQLINTMANNPSTTELSNQRLVVCNFNHTMVFKSLRNKTPDDDALTNLFCIDCFCQGLNFQDGFYHCHDCEESFCRTCGMNNYGKYQRNNNNPIFYMQPIQ